MALVSLCVPVYNGSAFLAECLASALAQTHPEVELLVVDDRSSDGSFELASRLLQGRPNARVLRNDSNLGLVGNWNRCLELARGEWIKFLFQDDLLQPACVERLLNVAEQARCRLAFCERDFVFDPATPAALRTVYESNRQSVRALLAPAGGMEPARLAELLLQGPFDANRFGEPTSALLHRSLVEDIGPFSAEYVQLCDLEYWLRAAGREPVAYLAQPLAGFRVHPQATSALNREVSALRHFQANGLDTMALLDALVHGPVFQPLQRCWQQAGQWQRALRLHDDRAHGTLAHVRGQPPGAAATAMQAAYAGFLERHPHCRRGRLAHAYWQARQRARRLARRDAAQR